MPNQSAALKQQLKETIASCQRCQWGKTPEDGSLCYSCNALAGPPVPMWGPSNAHIVYVGEAPGGQEVEQGIPFVGQAGGLLRIASRSAGIEDRVVYFTNVVKCRPVRINDAGRVSNRTPTEEEILRCPYLGMELEFLRPKIVVAFGRTALKGLFGVSQLTPDAARIVRPAMPMRQMHGLIIPDALRWDDGHTSALAVMYHPAAIIYRRQWRTAWEEDWAKLAAFMQENGVIMQFPQDA